MQLSPSLASILVLLTHAWVTTADTLGRTLVGGEATTPVDTVAKWLLQPVGSSLHPAGYVFKAFNDIDLQVVTSDVSPGTSLHLEPIEQGINPQSWNITCGHMLHSRQAFPTARISLAHVRSVLSFPRGKYLWSLVDTDLAFSCTFTYDDEWHIQDIVGRSGFQEDPPLADICAGDSADPR
ncbi:hypothetical protein DFH09DRAFT_1067534 [Mycena vulgaris]|nr:hypothetical protein DFH09DRAFT_1067534 [Mycena vulgaris]